MKLLGENISSNLDISHGNDFFGPDTKNKYKQIGGSQVKKLLHSKGNHQQNGMVTY